MLMINNLRRARIRYGRVLELELSNSNPYPRLPMLPTESMMTLIII